MKVGDLMTKDVITVAPEAALKRVAGLLVEHGVSGVPVVDSGRVVGVLSEHDVVFKELSSARVHRGLLAWLMDETDVVLKLDARTAGEAMTAPPVTIASGRSVADAAKLMLDENVSRLPVVDSGRLVGIVTEGDLVRAFARGDEEILHEVVTDALLESFCTPPNSLDASVTDGTVTVSGTVATREQARLIEALVDRIPGVVEVDARLQWGDAA